MQSPALLEPEIDVFGGIVEAYRREAFDAGYRRAKLDLLAELVFNCEQFLCRQPNPTPELRKTLYAFVDRIESQLGHDVRVSEFVEGGLGI